MGSNSGIEDVVLGKIRRHLLNVVQDLCDGSLQNLDKIVPWLRDTSIVNILHSVGCDIEFSTCDIGMRVDLYRKHGRHSVVFISIENGVHTYASPKQKEAILKMLNTKRIKEFVDLPYTCIVGKAHTTGVELEIATNGQSFEISYSPICVGITSYGLLTHAYVQVPTILQNARRISVGAYVCGVGTEKTHGVGLLHDGISWKQSRSKRVLLDVSMEESRQHIKNILSAPSDANDAFQSFAMTSEYRLLFSKRQVENSMNTSAGRIKAHAYGLIIDQDIEVRAVVSLDFLTDMNILWHKDATTVATLSMAVERYRLGCQMYGNILHD